MDKQQLMEFNWQILQAWNDVKFTMVIFSNYHVRMFRLYDKKYFDFWPSTNKIWEVVKDCTGKYYTIQCLDKFINENF